MRVIASLRVLIFASLAISFLAGCNDNSPSSQVSCTDQPGTICTWAGTGLPGYNGNGSTPEESALYWPLDLTFASDGRVYIVDFNNHQIRQVGLDGKMRTVVGGISLGDGPYLPTTPSDRIPPGAPGIEVALNHPTDAKELPDGKLLFVCWHNHKVRTFDPATGLVLVTCGAGPGFAGDGGNAASALMNRPSKAVVDGTGNVYVLDQTNERVRKIDTNGIINTVVGNGTSGFSGDGGPPLQASLRLPAGANPAPAGGLALDTQGRLYIADTLNRRIRRVDFAADVIETIAGTDSGFAGDDGPALNAKFAYPFDIEFGPDGRLYVADRDNNRIRAIDLVTGIISTVAGDGTYGFGGDGGSPLEASLARPSGLTFDPAGHLYIADTENNRIRRVTF